MDDDVRVWLVERSYTDKGMVTLVYATRDGERVWRRQLSPVAMDGGGVPAARSVAPADLVPSDDDVADRYAAEAARVAERHDPDDRL